MNIDELNDQIAASVTNSVTLPAGIDLHTNQPIRVLERPGFTLDLNRSIVHADKIITRAAMLIHGRNSPGIKIRRGTLIGTKPYDQGYQRAVEDHHGIALYGCTDFELDDLTIQHVAGDFIYLTTGPGPTGPNAAQRPICSGWIDNVAGFDAGRHAIAALAVDWLEIGTRGACAFIDYHHQAIDTERSGRFKTDRRTIHGKPLDPGQPNTWTPYTKPPKHKA